MSEKIYDVPSSWTKRAFIDDGKYQTMYAHSVKDPNAFWAEQARELHWDEPFTTVLDDSNPPFYKW
ncbi:MAG TPA: acetyl-coenzyme A synthetase N-terminal domain-containing protein, partial [Xanthobacteraceae bacterium]